jgi:hypothetical protein
MFFNEAHTWKNGVFYFGIKYTFLLFLLNPLSPKGLNFILSILGVSLSNVCCACEFSLSECSKLQFKFFVVFVLTSVY